MRPAGDTMREGGVATSGELVASGEPITRSDAFRRLADRHVAAGYRLARAILDDASDAEDRPRLVLVSPLGIIERIAWWPVRPEDLAAWLGPIGEGPP